jgi:hypothetical protein
LISDVDTIGRYAASSLPVTGRGILGMVDGDLHRPEATPGRHIPLHRTRLAQLVDEAHLTRDDAVDRFDRTARTLNERVSVSPRQFARWMAGDGAPRPAACRVLEQMFKLSIAELLRPVGRPDLLQIKAVGHAEVVERLADEDSAENYASLDDMNERVHSLLNSSNDAPIAIESLEEAVEVRARAAVEMPPREMIRSLSDDLGHVYHALRAPAVPEDSRRRLLRIGGLFSTLLAEEFMIVGHESRSRRWFATADRFSSAAGDLATRSLAASLCSRLPLYFGEVAEAVEIARRAQDMAPANHLALALAPMAEALALAQLGDRPGSGEALDMARVEFERLDDRFLRETVFGLSARRFSFYESRVLLDTGEPAAAWRSQEEALRLYPPAMIGDVVMIHLDRARLLILHGDVEAGCGHATDALLSMPIDQRADIFRNRALRLLAAVPRSARSHKAVAELRGALAELSGNS